MQAHMGALDGKDVGDIRAKCLGQLSQVLGQALCSVPGCSALAIDQ